MAFGVPNVVTRLAAEGMQLTDGKEVLIADSPEDFASAVVRAYTHAEVWQELSDAGLEYLEEKASVPAVGRQLKKMLISLGFMEE